MNPRKTLAADSDTPADTVARWIGQARQRGKLSPAEPGKASGSSPTRVATSGERLDHDSDVAHHEERRDPLPRRVPRRRPRVAHAYGGSFATQGDALARKRWIDGELAARRVPDLRALERDRPACRRSCVTRPQRWQASRVDVSDNTRLQHRSAVRAMLATLGDARVDSITAGGRRRAGRDAHREGPQARDGAQERCSSLAMVLDFAGVTRRTRRATRSRCGCRARRRRRSCPPTAEHVEAVHRRASRPLQAAAARARRDRDAARRARGAHAGATSTSSAAAGASRRPWRRRGTAGGCRCPRSCSRPCWRSCRATTAPRNGAVFQGFGGDRFRTAITRACTAAGVPAFSPARPPPPPDLARCTSAACRGRGSASTSASATSP